MQDPSPKKHVHPGEKAYEAVPALWWRVLPPKTVCTTSAQSILLPGPSDFEVSAASLHHALNLHDTDPIPK